MRLGRHVHKAHVIPKQDAQRLRGEICLHHAAQCNTTVSTDAAVAEAQCHVDRNQMVRWMLCNTGQAQGEMPSQR